jgi:hypothetical protein
MAHLDQADLGSRVVSGVRLGLLDQVDHLSSRCCWIFWIQVGRISLVEQVLWIKRFCQLLMGQVVITAWQVLMVHLDQADHLDCWCCWIFWLSRIKWYKFGKWNNGILGTATYIPLLMARILTTSIVTQQTINVNSTALTINGQSQSVYFEVGALLQYSVPTVVR